MISFSDAQVGKLSELSLDRFASETASLLSDQDMPLDGEDREAHVRRIAAFCWASGISDAALITSVVMAHCRDGRAFPPSEGAAKALERPGFSEAERVTTYLSALNGSRRRVTLDELREMA